MEVLEGVSDSLDSREIAFPRLIALADELGCMWSCPLSSLLPLPTFNLELTRPSLPQGPRQKAGADGGVGPEITDTSPKNAVPTEKATHAAAADTPPSSPAAAAAGASSYPIPNNNLFSAATNFNSQLATLHAAVPP
jgi:hypothetical protein